MAPSEEEAPLSEEEWAGLEEIDVLMGLLRQTTQKALTELDAWRQEQGLDEPAERINKKKPAKVAKKKVAKKKVAKKKVGKRSGR